MGYNAPYLTCAGPGGSGICRSQSPVTHIRESTWKTAKGDDIQAFSLECANCARKRYPDHGHEQLPEARKLTPAELAQHQKNQQEGYDYEHRGEWD